MDRNMQQIYQQMGMGKGMGGGPKAQVEFKAGKMDYDGRMVKPDRRKGTIKVQNEGPEMKKFQWFELDNPAPVEEFYCFAGEVKFEKVK